MLFTIKLGLSQRRSGCLFNCLFVIAIDDLLQYLYRWSRIKFAKFSGFF